MWELANKRSSTLRSSFATVSNANECNAIQMKHRTVIIFHIYIRIYFAVIYFCFQILRFSHMTYKTFVYAQQSTDTSTKFILQQIFAPKFMFIRMIIWNRRYISLTRTHSSACKDVLDSYLLEACWKSRYICTGVGTIICLEIKQKIFYIYWFLQPPAIFTDNTLMYM